MGPIATAIMFGGNVASVLTQHQAANAQARADKQKSEIEAAWARRRAFDEQAAGQIAAGDELRKADLLQSSLRARAGASGSGAADPTIQTLWGDIEAEGDLNAGRAAAAGEQRAAGLRYNADLDRWTTDANVRIKRLAAKGQLVGGLAQAAGSAGQSYFSSRMAARYSTGDVGTASSGSGYGMRYG